jgi:hypothetical protein
LLDGARGAAQGADKDLVGRVRPRSPLTGDLGVTDLVVLERFANPNVLVKAGAQRLTAVIAEVSHNKLAQPGRPMDGRRPPSLELYAGHPDVALDELAAEIATEVRAGASRRRSGELGRLIGGQGCDGGSGGRWVVRLSVVARSAFDVVMSWRQLGETDRAAPSQPHTDSLCVVNDGLGRELTRNDGF